MPIHNDLPTAFRRILLLLLLSLAPAAHALDGCPWIPATSSSDAGLVDINAAYWSSVLPNDITPGTVVQIYSTFPQMRFFNFTIYHQGKTIDHLADADLVPLEGGALQSEVAAIPYSNNYADHYLITIKYEDVPPVREPNTLYAGSDTAQPRLLMMRDYLPNEGVDKTGGVGLPELTQINPDGSSQRYDTSSPNLGCPFVDALSTMLYGVTLSEPGIALKNPAFSILPPANYNYGAILIPPYSNFDSGYGSLMTSPTYGNLLLIRSQLPVTPSSNADPATLQARYLSFCEYHAADRMQLGCLADPDLVTQSDGYFTIVVSTADMQPPLADPADGYNWLPWYNSTDRTSFVVRQLLPEPGFAGNYMNAGNTSDPIGTLGVWAPLATYCDAATFDTYAPYGGATVFAQCQAATKAGPQLRSSKQSGLQLRMSKRRTGDDS